MNDNLSTSENGLNFISNWEGCVLHVYKDIAGLNTIGIGHLIVPGETFTTITKEQALQLLAKDVGKCEAAIKKYIKVELNQNQFDALVSWSFNCGTGVLAKSGVSTELNNGNYNAVPTKLLDWCKYTAVEDGKKVLKTNQGLYNRRKAEGELFSNPVIVASVKDGNGILSSTEIEQINNLVQITINDSINSYYESDYRYNDKDTPNS